jgi:hypothetical protein
MTISRITTKMAHERIEERRAGSNDPRRPARSVERST